MKYFSLKNYAYLNKMPFSTAENMIYTGFNPLNRKIIMVNRTYFVGVEDHETDIPSQIDPDVEYYGVREVAKLLKTPKQRVRVRLKYPPTMRGHIKGVQIKSCWFIPKSSLEGKYVKKKSVRRKV